MKTATGAAKQWLGRKVLLVRRASRCTCATQLRHRDCGCSQAREENLWEKKIPPLVPFSFNLHPLPPHPPPLSLSFVLCTDLFVLNVFQPCTCR